MTKILDFVTERKTKIEQKRRSFERVLFENFLGSYSVIDDQGSIYQIELVDISEAGCLFQVPWNENNDKKFEKGKEINLRMYFTQTSYIPAIAKVKYGKQEEGKDGRSVMQYGCEFDQELNTYEAIAAFVNFLSKFAELSVEDRGDSKKIYFL